MIKLLNAWVLAVAATRTAQCCKDLMCKLKPIGLTTSMWNMDSTCPWDPEGRTKWYQKNNKFDPRPLTSLQRPAGPVSETKAPLCINVDYIECHRSKEWLASFPGRC